MRLRKASAGLAALIFMGSALSAPLAGAVDNTWFSGTVSPGTTHYEGPGSWGFLRTSSNADSGLTNNSFVVMTCRLGIYSSVGGDTCSVSTSQLNNERASFTYDYRAGYQQAPARAWIGGIPSGGMRAAEAQEEPLATSKNTRWTDGEWSLQELQTPDGNVRLEIDGPEVQASTDVSAEAYASRGGSISLQGDDVDLSFVVFPASSGKANEIAEIAEESVDVVSPGVIQRTSQSGDILEFETGSGSVSETALVY